MVDRSQWAEGDLRLIRALQLAPRASFAYIGEVLGMHERTVARRYQALRREGVVRIFGVLNPLAVGQQLWQVRLRCRPDASESLARALAARDDVAWVGISAAGSEVSFSVRSLSEERRDLLLTRTLPRSAHVLGIEASVVLHVFLGLNAEDWAGLDDHVTTDQAVALAGRRARVAEDPEPVVLEAADVAMVAVLGRDGRAGYPQLAAAAGISESRAARRLATLIERRALIIDLDLASEAFGFSVGARLHLQVTPARMREVGRALASVPGVGFVAATSGRDNLMASLTCRDLGDLYDLTSARVGVLDGIQAMEIVPFSRIVKQSGGPVVDGRLVDPAPRASS